MDNNYVEQYVHHFNQYYIYDWDDLLPPANFADNNNNHVSIGVSPFKLNYTYKLKYRRILSAKKCILAVET